MNKELKKLLLKEDISIKLSKLFFYDDCHVSSFTNIDNKLIGKNMLNDVNQFITTNKINENIIVAVKATLSNADTIIKLFNYYNLFELAKYYNIDNKALVSKLVDRLHELVDKNNDKEIYNCFTFTIEQFEL